MEITNNFSNDSDYEAGFDADWAEFCGDEAEHDIDEMAAEDEAYANFCSAYEIGEMSCPRRMITLFALNLISSETDCDCAEISPARTYFFTQGLPVSAIATCWDPACRDDAAARDEIFEILGEAVHGGELARTVSHLTAAFNAVDMPEWHDLRQAIWAGDDMKMKADIIALCLVAGPTSIEDVQWALQDRLLYPMNDGMIPDVADLLETFFHRSFQAATVGAQ